MRASQANRAVIAARAAHRPTRTTVLPSTDSLRIKPSGYVGRKGKARMTGAQRNSQGQRSEWTMSPYFWTDPKWGA